MTETKLERAKRITLKKFIAIKNEAEDLINHAAKASECGFCQEWEDCGKCPGRTQCRDMEKQFINFVECALNYLQNELIPWLEPPEEE